MIKCILIKGQDGSASETSVVDTVLESPIDIMQAYLGDEVQYTRDWDDEKYFDQLDWAWKHYEVTPCNIVKI